MSLYKANGAAFTHIASRYDELAAFRRDLHQHPELGFQEIYTAGRVAAALKLCGVDEVHTGLGTTGVVAVVRGKSPADARQTVKAVGLRADMDALPIKEQTQSPWASQNVGKMHACGHDGHTAMLLGAAQYLAQTRNFAGTAVLIFQPGEEGYAGARAMMQDGLFERFPVDEVYAIHNSPDLPAGTLGVGLGPMQAAADKITITITGKGGHGARPHQCVDPIVVAAHIVTAVQNIASRNTPAADALVVSICAIEGGDMAGFSVIPQTVRMVGTVRTYKPSLQDAVEAQLRTICEGVAAAFGATAELAYERIYPATINTEAQARFVGDVAASLVGEENTARNLAPVMGAEDFSFMLQAKPGAYMRVGQGTPESMAAGFFLHHPRYDFNDHVLPLGAALYASLVEQRMPLPSPQSQSSSVAVH